MRRSLRYVFFLLVGRWVVVAFRHQLSSQSMELDSAGAAVRQQGREFHANLSVGEAKSSMIAAGSNHSKPFATTVPQAYAYSTIGNVSSANGDGIQPLQWLPAADQHPQVPPAVAAHRRALPVAARPKLTPAGLLAVSSVDGHHVHRSSRVGWTSVLVIACFCVSICVAMLTYICAKEKTSLSQHKPRPSVGFSSGCSLDDMPFKAVVCKDEECRRLAWCSQGNALMVTHPASDVASVGELAAPWDETSLSQVLDEHGISSAAWSAQAKLDLVDELIVGKARLVRYGSCVVRVVELVLLVVEYPSGSLVLQEVTRCVANRFGVPFERAPASRRRFNESAVDVGSRILVAKLQFPPDVARVSEKFLSIADVEESFDFYQGLPCLARKFVVKATVGELSPSNPDEIGVISGRHQVRNVSYEWVAKEKAACFQKIDRLAKCTDGIEKMPHVSSDACLLVLDQRPTPILPWTESSVSKFLQKFKVEDAERHFGVSIQRLLAGLRKGEYFFGFDQANAKLVCVAEKIHLGATSVDGRVMVQKITGVPLCGIDKYSLPFTDKLPMENVWCAARRIAYSYFGDDCVSEKVCIHEFPPEQIAPMETLEIEERELPTENMIHRALVVSASIRTAMSDDD